MEAGYLAMRERLAQLEETAAGLAEEVRRLRASAVDGALGAGQAEQDRQPGSFNRRAALAKLGTAAAVGVGAVAAAEIARPERAAASAGTMFYGTTMDAGADQTTLTSTNTNWTFQTGNTGQPTSGTHAAGLFGGSAFGIGIVGTQGPIDAPDTTLTPAILGRSKTSPGVMGLSNSSGGVFGSSDLATAVQGNAGAGTGVYGVSVGPSGAGALGGVVGDSNTNAGVAGFASAASRGAAEFTHTAGGRAGIFGLTSISGKAQIRLNPAHASTHPSSGAKGDLFVDSSGRLWFCKGSTNWKQLA